MTNDWATLFGPVATSGGLSGRPLEPRVQQEMLGQAVLDAYANGTSLVAEARTGTGKSYAYLVPAILAAKHKTRPVRTVVSTETLALMDQLVDRDLPNLERIYGGFTFRSLKGRSNYLCANRLRLRPNSPAAKKIKAMDVQQLKAFSNGERRDVERVFKRALTADEWFAVGGESNYCAENKCKPEFCFSTRARELALEADIVVTTHAMLQADSEVGGLFGDHGMKIVDEAHTLEKVLVDGWTRETSRRDIQYASDAVFAGLQAADAVVYTGATLRPELEIAFEGLRTGIQMVADFFRHVTDQRDERTPWDRRSFGLVETYLSGGVDPGLLVAMTSYEQTVPGLFTAATTALRAADKVLAQAADEMAEQRVVGIRKVNKARTQVRNITSVLDLAVKSMKTRDGVVDGDSTYYAVIGEGAVDKDGRPDIRIKTVPLDVSWRCSRTVWVDTPMILVSATLTDPTDESFRYTRASLGVSSGALEMRVGSPFDYAQNQLVYLTDGTRLPMNVNGARASLDELEEVLHASNGRTLVLFTAREELDHAASYLRNRDLPWTLLVQDTGADKQKLATSFRDDNHSVLLATKSFFTGVDFPGETCSTVVLAKFPLARYDSLCKTQIAWWKRRGFPKWYERESLTVFAQAAGRLIRTSGDRGVVALLDQRVADPRSNVHATAMIGVRALHAESRITRDTTDVLNFLGESVHQAKSLVV